MLMFCSDAAMLVLGRVGSSRHVTAVVSPVGCLCAVVDSVLCLVRQLQALVALISSSGLRCTCALPTVFVVQECCLSAWPVVYCLEGLGGIAVASSAILCGQGVLVH